jgi:hypothetical protein
MRTLRTLLSAAPLLLASCGDLFFVEAKSRSLCTTEQGPTFPGTLVPIPFNIPLSGEYTLEVGDMTELVPGGEVESELRGTDLTVTADTSLAGVDRIVVSVLPQDPGGPIQLLYAYERQPSDPTGNTVVVPGSGQSVQVDLARPVVLRVDVSGQPPTRDWTPQATACTEVKARLDYL